MAVGARCLNFFNQKIMQDSSHTLNQVEMDSGYNGFPFSAGNHSVPQSLTAKTSVNTDSRLTYMDSFTKKRGRNSMEEFGAVPNFPSIAGEEIFFPQIQPSQLEIDAIICQHNKKIRLGLEGKQNHVSRLVSMSTGVMNRLKEKDDQIQRIGKLNFILEERVKRLHVENQVWRDLAQTNEAMANSLRTNLEQVLSLQIGRAEDGLSGRERYRPAVEDDAESCCGSTDHAGGEGKPEEDEVSVDRLCRMCRERESRVLLLPCRHLCLCNVCVGGSKQVRSCPVCQSSINATLHVNTCC